MPRPSIVGFSANTARPSKTRNLVDALGTQATRRLPAHWQHFDLVDLLPSLATTTNPRLADAPLRDLIDSIENADALIVGTAVHKGAYTGLFKHVFDLIDAKALANKPVVLSATGGSERHALVIEHALRPLFGFFGAAIAPTGVYATERDFLDGYPNHTGLVERIHHAADELARLLVASRAAPHLVRSA